MRVTATSRHRATAGRRLLALSAAVLTLSLAFPMAASAASTSPGKHCTVELAPLEPGQTTSRIVSQGCFATFSQAMAFASHGRVKLSASATPRDLLPEMLATTYVLGIDFKDGSYSGASFTATGATGCSGGHNFAITSMPPTWDNQVSSNYPSSGCNRAVHWEDTSYGGAQKTCTSDPATCYYIGNAMNDRTSSEQWFDV